MKLNLKHQLCTLGIIVIFISACKRDKTIIPTSTTGTLFFHLHTNIGEHEIIAYDSVYQDEDNRKISLSLAQFYISRVRLHKTDGSIYEVPNFYLLKTLDAEEFTVGAVPVGNYTSISFDIGIDSAANYSSPNNYSNGSPLAPKSPSMWFGDNQKGYIFMNVSGKVDTTVMHHGDANMPFSFKIGMNALRKTIDMPASSFSVLPDEASVQHIICDYGVLLKGLDFKSENLTDSHTQNPALAQKIANRITNMFHFDQ